MVRTVAAVLADALHLDPRARAEIAAELIASLDSPADPDVDTAWQTEVMQRMAALDAGTLPLEDWDTVQRRIGSGLSGG